MNAARGIKRLDDRRLAVVAWRCANRREPAFFRGAKDDNPPQLA